MKFVYLLFFIGLVTYSYAGKGWKKEIKKLKIRIDQLEDKIDAMNCYDGHCLSKQKTSKLSTSVLEYRNASATEILTNIENISVIEVYNFGWSTSLRLAKIVEAKSKQISGLE